MPSARIKPSIKTRITDCVRKPICVSYAFYIYIYIYIYIYLFIYYSFFKAQSICFGLLVFLNHQCTPSPPLPRIKESMLWWAFLGGGGLTCTLNLSKPTGYVMHYQFNIQHCTLCPHCIYVFCIYLRTNSDLCHLQHKLTGFYNRDE